MNSGKVKASIVIILSAAAAAKYIHEQKLAIDRQNEALGLEAGRALSWETIAGRERATRQAYEAALGLSFWSEQRVTEELWERARQGEPLALEILKIRTRQEAEETAQRS